ncbi:MAG: hypothetical protein SFW36_19505 [Leptolyngbyaceae cyanobacterium bins.59]|nr:hypothetical protein [Leptolyngbyaceae cyanobacterium bins.59]
MKLLSFSIAATFAGLSVILPMTSQQKAHAATCVTWASYSRNLPLEGGRGGQWKAFNDLPSDFQNGCVLLENNNSVDIAYVLKRGINPTPYIGQGSGIPSFCSEQQQTLNRLVAQGKALQVTWLTPTQGSLDYLRSIPKDKPFLRDDGMTCFNSVCMKSAALSHNQLGQILSFGSSAQAEIYLDSQCQRTATGLENGFRVDFRRNIQPGGQPYWFSMARAMDGAAIFCLTRPNYTQGQRLATEQLQNQFIREIKQESKKTSFLITVAYGNGLRVPLAQFRLNLDNPTRPTLSKLREWRDSR